MMSQGKVSLAGIIALVLAVAAASAYDCPEDCECMVINGATAYNHAKCTSLKGLMEGKSLPIHSIDLSNIGLTRIPSHQLEKLRDLTTVDLSNNELSEVGRLGRRVKSLNLKHNRITSGKLSKIPQRIQHLDLSNNELTYLPLELSKLTKLRTIELTNNQINCSCETLEVRNWLQEKHVYTQNPVRCTYPAEVKGKPWLQVKQSEICEREKKTLEIDEDEEENELMLGDQPAIEGSAEENGDEEELGKDYMPVDKKKSSKEANPMDDVEGSGDLSMGRMSLDLLDKPKDSQEVLHPTESAADAIVEDEDGSGSGMGALFVPRMFSQLDENEDDMEDKKDTDETPDEGEHVEEPSQESSSPSDIFGQGLGIAQFNDPTEAPEEVSEEPIIPVVFKENEDSAAPSEENADDGLPESSEVGENGNVEKASIMVANEENGDSKGTYFLLGVILLLVLGLILFVGIKRCKANDRGRAGDVENARSTELMDMDKKNLGKPIQKNGHEHAPLIGEKKKEDLAKPVNGNKRTSYENEKDKKTHEPLLNGDSKPQSESNNNNVVPPEQPIQPTIRQPEHIEAPYDPNHRIIPRYPPPKSPRASKQNHQGDDDVFLPSSPKMGRYSPVYSPETGKVKIKLTETPKPKTPLLVTRSKSNAGDIITTPVARPATTATAATGQDEVGVHQPPAETQQQLQ